MPTSEDVKNSTSATQSPSSASDSFHHAHAQTDSAVADNAKNDVAGGSHTPKLSHEDGINVSDAASPQTTKNNTTAEALSSEQVHTTLAHNDESTASQKETQAIDDADDIPQQPCPPPMTPNTSVSARKLQEAKAQAEKEAASAKSKEETSATSAMTCASVASSAPNTLEDNEPASATSSASPAPTDNEATPSASSPSVDSKGTISASNTSEDNEVAPSTSDASQKDDTSATTKNPDAVTGDALAAAMLGGAHKEADPGLGDGFSQTPPPPPATQHEPQVPATSAPAQQPEEDSPMSLLDHLSELRVRLVRCMIAIFIAFALCYSFAEQLFNELMVPLVSAMPKDSKLIFTALPEAFFVYMQVGLVAATFVASPYIFYQIWAFISPGLYDEEKKSAMPVAFFSALFFIGGAAFCYYQVFPYAFKFFMGFATDLILPMPSLSAYLGFALKMLLAFGLIFEMPLFAFFLARIGLVTADMMRKSRKYAILCIFIVAAILTPPDVFSQTLMACPMLVLYEISIFIAAAVGKKKQQQEKEEKQPESPMQGD